MVGSEGIKYSYTLLVHSFHFILICVFEVFAFLLHSRIPSIFFYGFLSLWGCVVECVDFWNPAQVFEAFRLIQSFGPTISAHRPLDWHVSCLNFNSFLSTFFPPKNYMDIQKVLSNKVWKCEKGGQESKRNYIFSAGMWKPYFNYVTVTNFVFAMKPNALRYFQIFQYGVSLFPLDCLLESCWL